MVHGNDEQKARHLPPIARAEVLWCQGFSEPGAGSDLASLQTRAERDGDDYIINGQKIWTSEGHLADWMILLARTDQEAPVKYKRKCYYFYFAKKFGSKQDLNMYVLRRDLALVGCEVRWSC
jgi:alkylation response protein AidB-like acyl-CoA dehydrogenase